MTRRWRLFPKYALLIITLVGAMLIASGAIGLYFSWRETEAHLVALQVEKAQNAATRIEQYVLDIEHQLSWTALPRAEGDGDALEQRRIEYLKLQRQAPQITEVAWIDPKGREQLRISRLAMDAISSGTDLSQEPKFRVASTGTVYYGPVYFRKGTEPYMTIARPAGPGGGVTATEVNLKFVWDVVSQIKIGESGLAYVVDSTGTLVAHPDISLVLKKSDLSTLPQVAALLHPQAAPAATARDLKGNEVFSAHALIPTLHWTVFVESPRAEALAPLKATLQRTSLFLVAALLISIAASFFLARALVRPLRALQEGAAQIGAGDLDRHIEVRTGDELEGLAEQFNHMSAQLRESYAGLERKVEQRTAEVTEALERQTATAEILGVISGSVADSQPVFEKILESCAHLFASNEQGILLLGEDEQIHLAAHRGSARERLEVQFPTRHSRMAEPVVLGRRVLHYRDVLNDDGVPEPVRAVAERIGIGSYSQVFAPMVWRGEPIGTLYVIRQPPTGFSDKEIDLLRTFADQAVIAIQNARLFKETKEALQRQTATAEILKVISESPTDVQPVFEAIVQSGVRMFEGASVAVSLPRDGQVCMMAIAEGEAGRADKWRSLFPFPLDRGYVHGAALLDGRVIDVADALDGEGEFAVGKRHFAESGYRAMTVVPMMRGTSAIGAISVVRLASGPLAEKQLALLQTFADQAVIAIENVRLFNETKEALEQQTATAEVLQVISSSVADAKPVFDTILDSCERLFAATALGIYLIDDAGMLQKAGFRGDAAGARAAVAGEFPRRLEGTATAIAVRERRVVHYPDVLAAVDVPAPLRRVAEVAGNYSIAFAPMLWEERGVGAIQVSRDPPNPFTD